jgi:nicotinamidase-related amidase
MADSIEFPDGAALVIIDLQKAIDDPKWRADGERNNPGAEATIGLLLTVWRDRRWPVIHVRHASTFPDSPYRPGQPGNDFKVEVAPVLGETVFAKATNSAFIGTGLEAFLRGAGITSLVVAGVITNNSVESTVRMAGNLRFDTFLVSDGCFTFGRRDFDGRLRTAEEVHAMTLANLDGEYCRVLRAEQIVAALQQVSANPAIIEKSPTDIVQRQLDAYNRRDIDAFMQLWAEDAQYFEHPSKLLANGAAEIRERHIARFREPNLHGRLLSREILGNKVVDREIVTRLFPDGPGHIEVIAIYETVGDKIAKAWFIFGTPVLDPA